MFLDIRMIWIFTSAINISLNSCQNSNLRNILSTQYTSPQMIPCFQKGIPLRNTTGAYIQANPSSNYKQSPAFLQKKHPHNTTAKSPNKSPSRSFCLSGLDFERFFIKAGRLSQTDFSRSPSRTWLLVSWQRAAFSFVSSILWQMLTGTN